MLDVGCGGADVSFLAARMVGPEGAVIGVDISAEAMGVAWERALQAGVTGPSGWRSSRTRSGAGSWSGHSRILSCTGSWVR